MSCHGKREGVALQGKVAGKDRLVDFSGFHTALLWAGPTLVAAGVAPCTPSFPKGPFCQCSKPSGCQTCSA